MASLQPSVPSSEVQSFLPQMPLLGDEDAPAWSLPSPGGPAGSSPSGAVLQRRCPAARLPCLLPNYLLANLQSSREPGEIPGTMP